ncbi:MAG TPA: hypothetical protein VI298_09795 [Geobacteraceae bacterium]
MPEGFIPARGGYQKLLSYQKAEIVYDAMVCFCDRFIDRRSSGAGGAPDPKSLLPSATHLVII